MNYKCILLMSHGKVMINSLLLRSYTGEIIHIGLYLEGKIPMTLLELEPWVCNLAL